MLVTLKKILKIAEKRNIAIGAFNAPNFESLQAVMCAAEELNLPVIIQFAECHEPWMELQIIGPIMIKAAQDSSVPVCVHLDHGETLEYLKKALDLGFSSIMYDGSVLPYEENVANTRKAVKMAKEYGASVEAELGSMGRRESGSGKGDSSLDDTKIYTDPAQAKAFVEETEIDALACSFGTTHGIYLSEPKLDFEIVKRVREQTQNIPVVMHGGSGIRREDYRKAICAGVRKINYFTYMDQSGGVAVSELLKKMAPEEKISFSTLSMKARDAMKYDIKEVMKVFAMTDQHR